ncbi:hypothetical protein LSUE1_G000246 [Lachnellula suecica]|uniref:Apc15p protein-domain-containing protein n=1 Tax=Lachnellula suecica TaxID=602035 RepID=A0A8T9CJR6_9HELO|nr:hypothetical protein LSUE1_G000246 [Lachnellula suecica]
MLPLPSLAPQDSFSVWYTSSSTNASQTAISHHSTNASQLHTRPSANHATSSRHPLARLRMDEEYIERRKKNVQNYGNSWIKPPGVPKSLYQLQEEKRELEEHQEAMRREALAQELAEAEAGGVDALLQGEGMDGDMEEARDLDDDVPEAETTRLESDEADDSDNEELDQDEVDEVPRGILASRLPDDVYREALVRGEEAGAAGFGDEGGSTIDGDESQMLQEEDLVHSEAPGQHDMDMDMDADLDDEIPEAGGYEHTDTEEELSSSEDDESIDAGVLPRYQPAASMVRSDGTQNSNDLSSMLSNGSSQIGSSPRQRSARRPR